MYLAIIWGGVFISSYMANKTKLTPVLYFLAFGSIMVNMGILPEESSEFIKGFAEIGITLIMFALGFEEDSSHFVKGIKRSWGIALFGAIAPFVIAFSFMVFIGTFINSSCTDIWSPCAHNASISAVANYIEKR